MNFYNVLNLLCGLAFLQRTQLLCGLAFFLFGMQVMSHNLERLSGGKLEGTLKKMTGQSPHQPGTRCSHYHCHAVVPRPARSCWWVWSTPGIMHFSQTLNVIFGANIGTTLTAWLLSLTGIQSDNLFLAMLKPENILSPAGAGGRIHDYALQARPEQVHWQHPGGLSRC